MRALPVVRFRRTGALQASRSLWTGRYAGAFAEYVRLSADQAALLAAGDINPGTFVTGAEALDGVSDAFARHLSSTSERKILVTPNG
jgi:hypothetical protein